MSHPFSARRLIAGSLGILIALSALTAAPASAAGLPAKVQAATAARVAGAIELGRIPSRSMGAEFEVSLLSAASGSSSVVQTVATDSYGDYVFLNVNPGTYTLLFHYLGTGGVSPNWYWGGTDTLANAVSFDVTTDSLGAMNIVIPDSNSIRGTVTMGGTPVAGATVSLVSLDPSAPSPGPAPTTTDSSGHYDLSGVPDGPYKVEFSDPLGAFPTQWWSASATQADAQTIDLVRGLGADGIDASILSPATLTVHPLAPVVGLAYLYILSATAGETEVERVSLNGSGDYVFTALPPGTFRAQIGFFGDVYSYTEEVTLAEGASATIPATPQLSLSGPVRGSLDYATNAPGGGITVGGWAFDPATSASINVAITVDGVVGAQSIASISRPDVATAFGGYGPFHGFSDSLVHVSPGVHRVCAVASLAQIGCSTVSVLGSDPVGALDTAVQTGPGSVTLGGWAIDGDAASAIQVRAYVDGVFNSAATADADRPDLGVVYPQYGSDHGVSTTVTGLLGGTHAICLYGINVAAGGNALMGCRSVNVLSGSPFGSLDSVRGAGPGAVRVTGWAIDPDVAASVTIAYYVDGASPSTSLASDIRADVAAVHPGFGDALGFSPVLTGLSGGIHTVCAYAINQGAGTANTTLGCRTLTVPTGNPFGSLDSATSATAGSLTVGGWALDPDTASPVTVHVYVDGAFTTALTADGARDDIAAAFPGYGAPHGFSTTLTGIASGVHTVCLYAINVGVGGANQTLGCAAIRVS